MGIWDPIVARLKIWTQDDEVRRPTPADLDRYEAEAGFKLPDDYRSYALTFGPGELGRCEFCFSTPGFPKAGDLDLAEKNRIWLKLAVAGCPDKNLAERFGDAWRARRLIHFCEVSGIGDRFAWDPMDVTDAETHEYGIYALPVDSTGWKNMRVARTFREFVLDYALGGQYTGWGPPKPEHLVEPIERDGTGPIQFAQSSLKKT
jgi:hypothetical protein